MLLIDFFSNQQKIIVECNIYVMHEMYRSLTIEWLMEALQVSKWMGFHCDLHVELLKHQEECQRLKNPLTFHFHWHVGEWWLHIWN